MDEKVVGQKAFEVLDALANGREVFMEDILVAVKDAEAVKDAAADLASEVEELRGELQDAQDTSDEKDWTIEELRDKVTELENEVDRLNEEDADDAE